MTQIYSRAPVPPLHERASHLEHRQDYCNSTELRALDRLSSQFADPQYERNGWKTGQPRSLMNDHKERTYVAPAPKGDMYQNRPEIEQKPPPREQLPPLSSLFGSAPRPSQSSYSEGHSPIFPAASPRDNRHPGSPLHPDRPYESYLQRSAISRTSYSSRPELVERHGIYPPPPPPPPPRALQTGTRPESPRYDSRYGIVDAQQSQASSSGSAWSPGSQYDRNYTFSRDTSSSFRPQPGPVHRPDPDSRSQYREPSRNTPMTPTYPPTPASTVAGDPATTKDGLGPKIWTGTQFLPRFVRQVEVPGEGMCYFYDDGTHCKTVIDGEVVNAHWGVTKAGKPRKRLAIACITCREKKIKCDPDYPRCVQCEKFGRICKFKNAPRGGQGSPDTPPAEPEDSISRPSSSRAEGESFKSEKGEGTQSVSPRPVLRQATPDSETHPSKRQRTGYGDFTPVASEASPRPSLRETASPLTPWTEPSSIDYNSLFREWHINPYHSHPSLVAELLSMFFKHIPETGYCIFPETDFKFWVISGSEKSLDDLMLIYSILALGCLFSLKTEYRTFGAQYAAISRYACGNRHFSIQLVQSRFILALYYFACNSPNDASDFCGGALRAASALKLNLEMEKSDDAYLKTYPYGLNSSGYAECRRRTFWSCYLIDRFNGFSSGPLSVIHPEDVFLRLPCDEKGFGMQAEIQNPFFDATTPGIQDPNGKVGAMAYLINVSTVWGDVMANIYRVSQRPIPRSSSTFVTFYDNINRRLRNWEESLPSFYVFSPENLSRAANAGQLGTFITMHTVYHTTVMKLNRYIQQSALNTAQLNHHIAVAQHHAEVLLRITDTLAALHSSAPSSPKPHAEIPAKFSSPYLGDGILSAVDILSAKVPVSSIPDRLRSFSGAQSVLAELSLFWHSAKSQQARLLQRIRDLAEFSSREENGGISVAGPKFSVGGPLRDSGERVFEMREPLEKTFSRNYDCIYA